MTSTGRSDEKHRPSHAMARREVQHDRLSSEVVDAALSVSGALGPFYNAAIYINAMVIELRSRSLACRKNVALSVTYRNEVVGNLEADLIVDDTLIVLVSAHGQLETRFKDQLLRSLGAAGLKLELLLDFGGPQLQFSQIY